MLRITAQVDIDTDPMAIKTFSDAMDARGKKIAIRPLKQELMIDFDVENHSEGLEIRQMIREKLLDFSKCIELYLFVVFCCKCGEVIKDENPGQINLDKESYHYEC